MALLNATRLVTGCGSRVNSERCERWYRCWKRCSSAGFHLRCGVVFGPAPESRWSKDDCRTRLYCRVLVPGRRARRRRPSVGLSLVAGDEHPGISKFGCIQSPLHVAQRCSPRHQFGRSQGPLRCAVGGKCVGGARGDRTSAGRRAWRGSTARPNLVRIRRHWHLPRRSEIIAASVGDTRTVAFGGGVPPGAAAMSLPAPTGLPC